MLKLASKFKVQLVIYYSCGISVGIGVLLGRLISNTDHLWLAMLTVALAVPAIAVVILGARDEN